MFFLNNIIVQEDLEAIAKERLNWNKLEGKTILISGANGFLPAYMVETILFLNESQFKKKTKVIALVRNIEKAKMRFKNYSQRDDLVFLAQDVCEPITLNDKVNYIIHAASQASPKYYGKDPVGTLSANVLGTINLLKLAIKNDIESFLYFSSSEVYGEIEENKIPTKENDFGYLDPTQIRSCYAESKRMGENICVSWKHQYNVPIKIVRPFHIYGPGMALDDGRVYADFVSDIINNRSLILKSDGKAKRTFCYLGDATIAFFKVLFEGSVGEAYNIGNPKCEISIVDLAQFLVNLFPEKRLKLIQSENTSNNYLKSKVQRSCPDIDKINSLGWSPKISLNKGFLMTVLSYE